MVNPGGTRLAVRSVKLERVRVICPACGREVEAVARDGRVRGYCAVARQPVIFLVEAQPVWDCPYCDSNYPIKEQLKLHLIDKHHGEMQELANSCRSPQTISWAAGYKAAFCGKKDG